MSFRGFPVAALDFYDDLEMDNTRTFWEAHKHIYTESVLEPMEALTAELAVEFGTVKIFRPHRDVRFSKENCLLLTSQRPTPRRRDIRVAARSAVHQP